MKWTEQQQKVIEIRKKNILVSAAAGSGKTAVLVERIISMITEGEQPLDIDRLLVVTFTNAAAAQMREKIGKAIEKKLQEQPDHQHLQKQMTLLPSSQITTIHSFCLNVIRNYFPMIDLDPSFKMADEAEITLLKSDVIAELLECYYEEGRDDFLAFIESYSHSKTDEPVEELILQLHQFAMSYPWPHQWLEEKKKAFDIETIEEMYQTKWMQELMEYCKVVAKDLYQINQLTLELCHSSGGPLAYEPALLSDRALIESIVNMETYEEGYSLLKKPTFARLSGKKEEGVDPEKKEQIKGMRERIKKALKDLAEQYFYQCPEEMLQDLRAVKEVMGVLFQLTVDFMNAFQVKKEEKNIIDFNDLEHFALKILVKEEEGEIVPSLAALELSEHFEEILVDEYQDSNLVQETILQSISRERIGSPNRFMVGDVKQSIYKFRLAMPELFMDKYNTYGTEEILEQGEVNLYQRIDLDKNFRSRAVVLHGVNAIFEQIMQKSVGGIIYNEEASLKPGAVFADTDQCVAEDVELLLVTEDLIADEEELLQVDPDSSENPEEMLYTNRELEARLVAARIKELVDPEKGIVVFDERTGQYRPAEYKDMVILLRSMSGWSEVFVNTLMQEGIPAYADTSTGYFQTIEITTILNFLRVIDNPRQDIPLVGVLYSPIVGLSGTELAMIRTFDRTNNMYQAMLAYEVEGSDVILRDKIADFIKQLEEYRAMVSYTPIHQLLLHVLERTGYYYYASAMPAGDRRKANLDLLVSHAVRFEKGSYRGLFHFIRYIEKLEKYNVDFGEAVTSGEQDNTVRIMSIHKSKGLQFPIVFVSGMAKQFNTQDLRSKLVLHVDYGVGPEYIDSTLRTKIPTLLKKVIQKKVQIENLGEELRVLYVALTRAQEKLIMTGYQKDLKGLQQKQFSFFDLITAKSYMDWVLPAMANRMEDLSSWCMKNEGMSIVIKNKKEFLKEEISKQIFLHKDREELRSIDSNQIYDQAIREELKGRLSYEYPYEKDANLKVKLTVTELKKLGQFTDDEQSDHLFGPVREGMNQSNTREEFVGTVPDFIHKKEVKSGSDRGTLYHKVLESIDLLQTHNEEELRQQLQKMLQHNIISEDGLKALNIRQILSFITSEIAERMRQAQVENRLYKEKQFVFGVKAKDIIPDTASDELILIQGIVDTFFEEDGSLVLVDYKSDVTYGAGEEVLKKRYQVQLDYYQKALEQITRLPVKEKIIYSLYLGKEIRID